MADELRVQWTLTPAHPPQPLRHCATCGGTRPFKSSGKVRLNANGRRLDAWLIYRCTVCDRTWLRAILERCAVQHVSEAELGAMEQSSPEWVRRHEFDTAALKQYAETMNQSDDLRVIKPVRRKLEKMPRAIELSLLVPSPTGIRLDRFLSRELRLSRGQIHAAHRNNSILLDTTGRNPLRRKISGDMSVTLLSDTFFEPEFLRICDAIFATKVTGAPGDFDG